MATLLNVPEIGKDDPAPLTPEKIDPATLTIEEKYQAVQDAKNAAHAFMLKVRAAAREDANLTIAGITDDELYAVYYSNFQLDVEFMMEIEAEYETKYAEAIKAAAEPKFELTTNNDGVFSAEPKFDGIKAVMWAVKDA